MPHTHNHQLLEEKTTALPIKSWETSEKFHMILPKAMVRTAGIPFFAVLCDIRGKVGSMSLNPTRPVVTQLGEGKRLGKKSLPDLNAFFCLFRPFQCIIGRHLFLQWVKKKTGCSGSVLFPDEGGGRYLQFTGGRDTCPFIWAQFVF